MEKGQHVGEHRRKTLPEGLGPSDKASFALPVHMIAIVVGKDSSHQLSWRMHQSRNPFGEEGRIRTVDVSNPKAAILGGPASKLPIHQGNTRGTPGSGATPEESSHACSELVADGSGGPKDG